MVVAGRRWGKSRLAVVNSIVEGAALVDRYGNDLKHRPIYYVSPTFDQGKRNVWALFKDLGDALIEYPHENTGVIKLVNGRVIEVKGADRPDTLRGVGLGYAVLDEYADMKTNVWEEIIRPALVDVTGGCLFIGTPKGKNHFYELWQQTQDDPEWDHFEFTSRDNPFLPASEIEAMRKSMSSLAFRQEVEAKFTAGGAGVFKDEWLETSYADSTARPQIQAYYIAVDPAGFASSKDTQKSRLARLDETAIAVVGVDGEGRWWVEDILHGRWDVENTVRKIVQACKAYRPSSLGIEKGALERAILPYLQDTMRREQIYPHIVPVTHGNQQKPNRIAWALQGRFEHGQIKLLPGAYRGMLSEQLLDFPNPLARDDMIDALAYIDQLATVPYAIDSFDLPQWEPLDPIAGF